MRAELSGKTQSSGARIFLKTLEELGVDRVFSVSGSDYAAIIEEKVRGAGPELIVVPHEIPAVSAAIGYSLGGKVGVVGVHTLPGTANALGAVMNAFGSRIPLILVAGRTPYTEEGSPASRNRMIHWTQETRDQGGIVRQWTKWDYEVRRAEQIPQALSRALQLASSEPCGPVYLMLPREVTVEKAKTSTRRPSPCFEPGPTPKALEQASRLINSSENPVIITWRAGRKRRWFDSLANFADAKNIPVVNYAGETLNYPSSGRMALDRFDIKNSADLILVVECEVPWVPSKVGDGISAKVIKVDVDPGHQYIPFYSFQSDVAVMSGVDHFFNALMKGGGVEAKDPEPILKLRDEQQKTKEVEVRRWRRQKRKIHPRLLSHEIGKLGLAIVNEYPFDPNYCKLEKYGTYYANLSVGYLGWSMGAAVGLKMATGMDVIATVGDGAFMFGVPEAFYYLAHSTPVMVAIFDNGGWMSSSESAVDVYPHGLAARTRSFPGTEFERFELGATVEAFGGYFEMVERADEVAPALERGREALQNRKRIAVLQFVVERTR